MPAIVAKIAFVGCSFCVEIHVQALQQLRTLVLNSALSHEQSEIPAFTVLYVSRDSQDRRHVPNEINLIQRLRQFFGDAGVVVFCGASLDFRQQVGVDVFGCDFESFV
jgi:hypothetical protein